MLSNQECISNGSNAMPTKSDKWDGIVSFARKLKSVTVIGAVLGDSQERLEAELRRRVEPLLRLLDEQACSITTCGHADCERIRKELATWK